MSFTLLALALHRRRARGGFGYGTLFGVGDQYRMKSECSASVAVDRTHMSVVTPVSMTVSQPLDCNASCSGV